MLGQTALATRSKNASPDASTENIAPGGVYRKFRTQFKKNLASIGEIQQAYIEDERISHE